MIKRQKQESVRKTHPSKVFSPYRTIGLVSNKVPFSCTNLGQSFVVTTVVGRSFQIYDASNLNLLFVSQPQTETDIQCIQSHFHHTFVATKNNLILYKRARQVAQVDLGLEPKEQPRKLCVFGDFCVVATSLSVRVFKWTPELEHYTTIKLSQLLGSVVDVCHLPTYLNKVVVATSNCLVLVNVKTGKVVHTFDELPSNIITIEPSATALDIVAVATSNGDVHLTNVRTAITLFTLKTGESITSLSFRSDGAQSLGISNQSGDIFFYDLNSRRRNHSVRSIHSGPVSKIQFLTSQPICLSAGKDNVLYELAFDPSISSSNSAITPPPRILRQRGGHSKPPSCIEFTDTEAHFLLSGSLDQSLWAFSLRKDAQSHEFSQRQQGALKAKSQMSKQLGAKFPAIVDLAYESNKERQWDNILTVHKNEPLARSWSGKRGILGSYELPTADGANAKTVALSRCGNFGFVGSAAGTVAGYNIQSGKRRKTLKAHDAAVTGVACDPTNTLIISTSLDGTIKFHDFSSLDLKHTIDCGSAVSRLRYHRGSGLLAVSLDNMSLVVVDLLTFRKVRELRGHGNRITDFDFSPDGRWIISGALDNTIRTWDIPTGGCIDAVRVQTPVTSLRLSPGGEWMATAHVSGAGISLWTMRSQFHTISTKLVGDAAIQEITLPNVSGQGGAGLLDAALEEEPEEYEFEVENWDRPLQIDGLETLSLEPRHKFNMLVNLDTIKQRNKPIEAPKAPAKQPFFLGMPSTEEEQQQQQEEYSMAPATGTSENKFLSLLDAEQFQEACDLLAKAGPSATDIELRSFETAELLLFLRALAQQLSARRNFELVQAWLKMVLEMHGEVFAVSSEHKHELEALLTIQRAEIQKMQDLTRFGAGVLRYLRAL